MRLDSAIGMPDSISIKPSTLCLFDRVLIPAPSAIDILPGVDCLAMDSELSSALFIEAPSTIPEYPVTAARGWAEREPERELPRETERELADRARVRDAARERGLSALLVVGAGRDKSRDGEWLLLLGICKEGDG